MIEEQVEGSGRQIVMDAVRTGGGLTLRIGERTAALMLRTGAATVRLAEGAITAGRESGRMSERRLQRLANGDVHVCELSREEVRRITSSLNRAGVRYAVERNGDTAWLHFEGRDLDHVTHAVRRALDDAGYELRVTGSRPDRTEPERTDSTEPDSSRTGSSRRNDAHDPVQPDRQESPSPDADTSTARASEHTERRQDGAAQDLPPTPGVPVASGTAVHERVRRTIGREDTLTRLRELIDRKIAERRGRTVPPRRPDRSHAR